MTLWSFTQLATIITFITTLFILYRVYIEQKDATIKNKDAVIELLKEKNLWLEKQLAIAKEFSPDALLQQLDLRIKVYAEETERLSKDKNTSDERLKKREEQLQSMRIAANQTIATLDEVSQSLDAISKKNKRRLLNKQSAVDNSPLTPPVDMP